MFVVRRQEAGQGVRWWLARGRVNALQDPRGQTALHIDGDGHIYVDAGRFGQIDTTLVKAFRCRQLDADSAPTKVVNTEAAVVQIGVKLLCDNNALRWSASAGFVLKVNNVRERLERCDPMFFAETDRADNV